MQHEAIDGVVIRVKDYGDHDRYLTLLTKFGRMTLLSKGSHSLRGGQRGVSQLYTYGNFEYYRRGATMPILKGGSPIQPFYGLSTDLEKLHLAAYFCDLAYELSDEGEEAEELVRLLLNSLYAVSNDRYPMDLVKAAIEFRLSALSGYAPDVSACATCHTVDAEYFYLDVMNGALVCSNCLSKKSDLKIAPEDPTEASLLCRLSPSALMALRYLLTAPAERLFAFSLEEGRERDEFCHAAETYLLSHLERGFDSLQFYHSLQDKG